MVKATIPLLLLLAMRGSATVLAGGEDLFGPQPQSDRDFNEGMLRLTGFGFTVTAAYEFAGYPNGWGAEANPLRDGWFFTYLRAGSGKLEAQFLGSGATYVDMPFLEDVRGNRTYVPFDGSKLTIAAAPGTLFAVGMVTPSYTFYSVPAWNGDGLYHYVVEGRPNPEPGSLLLASISLLPIGLWAVLRNHRGRK